MPNGIIYPPQIKILKLKQNVNYNCSHNQVLIPRIFKYLRNPFLNNRVIFGIFPQRLILLVPKGDPKDDT